VVNPTGSGGTTVNGRVLALGRPRPLRNTHRNLHAGRFWKAAQRELTELAGCRNLRARSDAGGRFPRPLSGGATSGVGLFAPVWHSMASRTISAAFVDEASSCRLGGNSRRGVQPCRSGRELPEPVLVRLFHKQVRERVGSAISTSMAGNAGSGARFFLNKRSILGLRSSTSTDCRLDATQQQIFERRRAQYRGRRSANACGKRPHGGKDDHRCGE